MTSRPAAASVGALLCLCVTACGGDPAPEQTPDGAVVLHENAPQDLSGSSVVATEIDGDAATLRIAQGSSASRPTEVEEGGVVTIGGEDYRVEAVWTEGGGGGAGDAGGRVMIVPQG